MKDKNFWRFSFPLFLNSSLMKFIAAVRGLYISSMISGINQWKIHQIEQTAKITSDFCLTTDAKTTHHILSCHIHGDLPATVYHRYHWSTWEERWFQIGQHQDEVLITDMLLTLKYWKPKKSSAKFSQYF